MHTHIKVYLNKYIYIYICIKYLYTVSQRIVYSPMAIHLWQSAYGNPPMGQPESSMTAERSELIGVTLLTCCMLSTTD